MSRWREGEFVIYIYGERDSISPVPMRIEPFRHPSCQPVTTSNSAGRSWIS